VINDRIKVAVAYLGKKVEVLRDELSERNSIYASRMIEFSSEKADEIRARIEAPKNEADKRVKGYISFSGEKKE